MGHVVGIDGLKLSVMLDTQLPFPGRSVMTFLSISCNYLFALLYSSLFLPLFLTKAMTIIDKRFNSG